MGKLCDNCRTWRIVLTALLIVMSALVGYHWRPVLESGAMLDRMDYLISGATLILMVLVTGFGIDVLVSRVESEVTREEQEVDRLAELLELKDKTIREMSDALNELSQDNSALRQQLSASHARGAATPGGRTGYNGDRATSI